MTDIQDTYSAAVENTFHLTRKIDLVAGASYDWRVLQQAEGWALDNTKTYPTAGNGVYQYPTNTLEAFNWQSALTYRYSNDAKVYASVSDRTRFPTLFELYSLRFGSQLPNASLVPEKATNYEIGWAGKLWNANLSTAVFYSDVTNFIESVYTNAAVPVLNPNGLWVTQSQNVGNGHFIGWEGSADVPVTSSLMAGGNLTLIRRDIVNPNDPSFQLTGVPDAKGIFYVKWQTGQWTDDNSQCRGGLDPVDVLRRHSPRSPCYHHSSTRFTINSAPTRSPISAPTTSSSRGSPLI